MIVTLQVEAAERLGVSPKSLRNWIKEPGFPSIKKGYDVEKIQAWRDQLGKKGSEQSLSQQQTNEQLAREKLRKATADADKAEREEEEAKGNVLKRDEYELFVQEHIQVTRDRMILIPRTLCKYIPKKYHVRLRTEGEKEVRKILAEFARNLEEGSID